MVWVDVKEKDIKCRTCEKQVKFGIINFKYDTKKDLENKVIEKKAYTCWGCGKTKIKTAYAFLGMEYEYRKKTNNKFYYCLACEKEYIEPDRLKKTFKTEDKMKEFLMIRRL